MPSTVILAFAILLALAVTSSTASTAAQAPPTVDAVRMIELAPGITVALRPRSQRFDDGNSVYLTTARPGDPVLIIDAPTDTSVMEAWAKKAQGEGRPIRWLVNTHWHADHTQGNVALRAASPSFAASGEIIGHRSLLADVPQRAATGLMEQMDRLAQRIPAAKAALAEGKGLSGQLLNAEVQEQQKRSIEQAEATLKANRDLEFLAPTLAFETSLRLALGDLTVELYAFRAHTDGDTVVVLPQQHLAFTGDLLDELPYVGHGSPRSWIKALDTLAKLPIERFVPGHGDPFGRDHLLAIRGYLQAIVDTVDRAKSSGETLESVVETTRLPLWRELLAPDEPAQRFFDGTLAEALTAAWNEPAGSPAGS